MYFRVFSTETGAVVGDGREHGLSEAATRAPCMRLVPLVLGSPVRARVLRTLRNVAKTVPCFSLPFLSPTALPCSRFRSARSLPSLDGPPPLPRSFFSRPSASSLGQVPAHSPRHQPIPLLSLSRFQHALHSASLHSCRPRGCPRARRVCTEPAVVAPAGSPQRSRQAGIRCESPLL